jgi:hypothetical protein
MAEMRLYDLRVTVERIEGRSVCGLEVGDFFEVTESSRVRIPDGKHFCLCPLRGAATSRVRDQPRNSRGLLRPSEAPLYRDRAPRSAILTTGVAIPTNRRIASRHLLGIVVLRQEACPIGGGCHVYVGGEESLEGPVNHVACSSLHGPRNRKRRRTRARAEH